MGLEGEAPAGVGEAPGDGEAGVLGGALSVPAGDAKAPALVLIQEWWGLNDHMRAYADRFAAEIRGLAMDPIQFEALLARLRKAVR